MTKEDFWKEHWGLRWGIYLCIVLFCIVAICIIDDTRIRKESEARADAVDTMHVLVEPCEYNDGKIYYKGDCDTTRDLLYLAESWAEFERERERTEHRFQEDCEDLALERIYHFLEEEGEVTSLSFEEFKKEYSEADDDEELKVIVKVICGIEWDYERQAFTIEVKEDYEGENTWVE